MTLQDQLHARKRGDKWAMLAMLMVTKALDDAGCYKPHGELHAQGMRTHILVVHDVLLVVMTAMMILMMMLLLMMMRTVTIMTMLMVPVKIRTIVILRMI